MHYKRSIPGRLLVRVTAYLKVIGAEGLNESSTSFYSTPIITVKALRNRTNVGLFPSICNPSKICHKQCSFCPWPPLMTVALLERKNIRKQNNNPWRALWSGWSHSGRNHFPLRFQKPLQMQRSQPFFGKDEGEALESEDPSEMTVLRFQMYINHRRNESTGVWNKKSDEISCRSCSTKKFFFFLQFSQILAGDSIWLQRIQTTQEHSSEFC